MIPGHARLDQISGENRSFQSVEDPGFGQAGPENFVDEGSKCQSRLWYFICQFICILPFFLLAFLQTIQLALM